MSKITYTPHGDYLLPDLALPKHSAFPIGKYGMICRNYLKTHRKILYCNLLTDGKLNQYLFDIDKQTHDRLDVLIKQMADKQGIDENLKARNQMAWVGAMNNIKACAEEIVLKEVVYL